MDKIKILVLAEDYPNLYGGVALMYIHSRNKEYALHGIDVSVLNFSAHKNYEYDGIKVLTLGDYQSSDLKFDILVSHASNIRHHYRFLKKYGDRFPKFVFFYHGHEVLKINEVYSESYSFVNQSKIKVMLQNIYDDFKLYVWRKYLPVVAEKSMFVFVSKWMLEQFLRWTKIPYDTISKHTMITYNCIGKTFENIVFNSHCRKEYDFITIRSNLDGSKYAIDIVNNIAKCNPQYRFLIVGKGKIFDYYKKADNIYWDNRVLKHDEIEACLQKARCALMPTRTDAQGVMMCEMASTGMPLITSDIPVCHEVFEGFDNVRFISNELDIIDLDVLINGLERYLPYGKNARYYNVNTSLKEIKLMNDLIGRRLI